MMLHLLRSTLTISFWKYFLLSKEAYKTFFAVLGAAWLVIRSAQYTGLIDFEGQTYIFYTVSTIALIASIYANRPISRIGLKVPGKDLSIEVKVGDIFKLKGGKFISSNTTFDTDISQGIISKKSLQGQFTQKFFHDNLNGLDKAIENSIGGKIHTISTKTFGKLKRYEIGTVAKLELSDERFYFVAMSDLTDEGNAITSKENIEKSLKCFWEYVKFSGEMEDIVVPLVGTGRGRINIRRKQVINMIIESFLNASSETLISNHLMIVISPDDYIKYSLKLLDIKGHFENDLIYQTF